MNASPEWIEVEVVAAWPERVWRVVLRLPSGATLAQALADAAVREAFPEAATLPVGIHSRRCTSEQVLREGDRIELYRPLLIDPKRARRERADAARAER